MPDKKPQPKGNVSLADQLSLVIGGKRRTMTSPSRDTSASPGKKPPNFTAVSKYTVLNGVGYFVAGAILIVRPGVTQTLFREPAFAGHEDLFA